MCIGLAAGVVHNWKPFRGSQREFESGKRKLNIGSGSWNLCVGVPPSPPPEEERRADEDAVSPLANPAAST